MKICIKRGIVVCFTIGLIFLNVFNIYSQEYKYEIGSIIGASQYMGDVNKTKLFLNPGLAGGAIFRYNASFQWALKANLAAGSISGSSEYSDNSFPFNKEYSFNRSFLDVGAQLEFNIIPYSDKYAYIGTRPYTPYIFAGAGITYATGERDFFNLNMPFGVGFKYKLKNRMNIGIEFSLRKLFADDLDVTKDAPGMNLDNPYGIKSSILKNKDWYSFTLVFLTWEFRTKEDPCKGN